MYVPVSHVLTIYHHKYKHPGKTNIFLKTATMLKNTDSYDSFLFYDYAKYQTTTVSNLPATTIYKPVFIPIQYCLTVLSASFT